MKKIKLDFNKPEDAKRFLRGFRMPNGAKITAVHLANGKEVLLREATDEQIMQYATQTYEDLYEPEGSKCYFEEETITLH